MEQSEQQLQQLEKELKPYLKMLSQASDSIVNQDISSYPIFVMHQQQIAFGLPLIEKEKLGGKWSVHASTLEEFVTKRLIQNEKIEDFKKVYRNPKEQICIFVILPAFTNFIFIPRP